MPNIFYITTPLYYVNAPPHLGGTYTTIVADTIARYKRMMGFDVKLFSGTDEHGQNIERAARKQGTTPLELADRVYIQYVNLWKLIGIEYDEFVRTTEKRHDASVIELYSRMKANGYVYKGSYSGWYCVSCEAYAPESDPATPVPCPDCGRQTEWFSEESYFFKLSVFQDRLLDLYEKNPLFIRPESRRNEIISFVKSGLKDLSISRVTLKWGIPIPDDPNHVFYVWFDALIAYLTGIGFKTDDAKFLKYWPVDTHLVGKDILRFHTVYWPAFLLAAGLETPKSVFGHGWWLSQDVKMSKSR
ncbi:MAG: methionine--tRNA ligase, partial [Acidobacteria bacterium 13_1_20CM_2_55_15]